MAMNAFSMPIAGSRLPMPPKGDPMASAVPMATPSANMGRAVQNAFNMQPVAPAPKLPAQNPFAISQPQNPGPMANAFRGFATGLLGVDKVNAIDDRYKAQDAEAGKKNLAMLQQFRAMPVEQRMAALPQLSQAIGKQIPQEVMSDQAIDAQLAVMKGQLGIAPATPEPMSAKDAAEIKLKQDAAGRPTYFNTSDGVVSIGQDGKGTLAYDAPEKPVLPNMPDGWQMGKSGQPEPIPGYAEWYRKMHPADASGGGVAGSFRTLTPEEVKAAGYSPGTVVQRDGRGQDHVTARPSTAQTGQPSEAERAGGLHAQIAMNGLANILKMESGGYNRAGMAEQATFGFGSKERLYDQATMDFADGYLRAMTGAGKSLQETKDVATQFFPQFGDDKAVIEQKAGSRLNAIKAMKSKTGRSWNPEWDANIAALEQQTTVDPKVAQAQQMLDNWDQLPPIYKTAEMKRVFEQVVAAGKAPKSQWEPPPAAPAQGGIDLSQLTPEQLDQLEQQLSQGGQ